MTSEPTQQQTLSYLLKRFREAGIHPRTAFGQNFLIDLNLQQVLIDAAALGPDDVVLEIGTGTGGLTALLAARAAAVVTVEIDRHLFQLAGEELFDCSNVTMLQTDALAGKNHLNAAVLAAVYGQLAAAPGRHFKLVANLPYNVATPVISNLLALDRPPQTITCTIQKEVADRIVARPGTKDYGALAIWVQSQCRAEIVRVLGPTVFWPRPKVSSAFVRITLDAGLRGRIADLAFFHQFVRGMFLHRRKLLRSGLTAFGGKKAPRGYPVPICAKHPPGRSGKWGLSPFSLSKPEADALLAGLGFSANVRAEEIAPERMLALAEAVRGRRAGSPAKE